MPPPLPPSKRGVKATLHKLFILDAQGGYAGEYTLDENCVVEYGDFLAAVPEAGLEDQKTIFLAEWKATAIHGEKLSLVAISKGNLGPEEITWAKAALVATEAQLVAPAEADEDAPAVPPGPDKGVMESLARALDERDAHLKERERLLAEKEAFTRNAVDTLRQAAETRIADLRAQLEAAQVQHDRDVEALATERDRPRQEMEAIAKPPEEAPRPALDPALQADRRQLEVDRKYLQKYALDLIAREEAIRDREMKQEEEAQRLAGVREELETARAAVEAAKAAPPAADLGAAKREIDQRVKILQQKAFELLAREEKLREREQKVLEPRKDVP